MKYTQPKGTFDILPKELKEENNWKLISKWQFIEKTIKETCQDYGFFEIRTPMFESTEVFTRSVGDASDIVSKEMYTFEDKGGRSMSLRPEGTASVARAFVENHLSQFGNQHNLFYIGPFFRYDRPQAGRYRQFHQFGVEALGRADPYQDAEMIDFLCETYQRLGLKDLNILINSVGDEKSRTAYQRAFLEFLTPYFNDLSKESQERFSKNPLRILDTKDPKEKEILNNAPSLLNYLSDECKKHFEIVCESLTKIGLSYIIDPKLVRGLDYYNKTVFEITSNALGAQNTIGAGGRYDGLIKALGGPDIPSIGFATGIERVLHTMEAQKCPFPKPAAPFIFLIGIGEKTHSQIFTLLCQLRHHKIPCEATIKHTKMQKALADASSSLASYCLILGEDEFEKRVFQLKNLITRESSEISFDSIASSIESLFKNSNMQKKH